MDDNLILQTVEHLKELFAKDKSGNFSYVNDLGEVIEVIGGVEYILPTQEDLVILQDPVNKQDSTSLEDLKKELCID